MSEQEDKKSKKKTHKSHKKDKEKSRDRERIRGADSSRSHSQSRLRSHSPEAAASRFSPIAGSISSTSSNSSAYEEAASTYQTSSYGGLDDSFIRPPASPPAHLHSLHPSLFASPAPTTHSPAQPAFLSASPGFLDDSRAIESWLAANGFDVDVIAKLRGYTASDLFALSKSDMKTLIGIPAGIRLANRIKILQRDTQHNNSALDRSDISGRSGDARNSLRTARYGPCSVAHCNQGACYQCDNENCCASLCQLHGQKQLFTGFLLCSRCQADTLEGRVLSYIGINEEVGRTSYYRMENQPINECALQ